MGTPFIHNILNSLANPGRKKWLLAILAVLLFATCGGPAGKTAAGGKGYLDSMVGNFTSVPGSKNLYFRQVDSVYRLIPMPGETDQWQRYLLLWSYCYYTSREYQQALRYTDSMLWIASGRGNTIENMPLYAKSLLLHGDVLLAENQFEEAFDWYYRARQAIFETGDSCAFADYTLRLANISYHQHKYLDAVAYYKSVLAEQQRCMAQEPAQRYKNVQGSMDNIAVAYTKQGMVDSAEAYYKAALTYIAENEARFADIADFTATAKAVVWGNLAEVMMLRGNDSAAERLLKASISTNRLPRNAPEDAVFSRLKLTALYLKYSRLPEARQLLHDCSVAMDTLYNTTITARLCQLQAQYAAATGDAAGAYALLTRYIFIKDSLQAATGGILTADIHTEFDKLERNNQLQLLQQRSRAQALYIILLVVGVVMGAAIIALVWRNSRQSKKHIVALTSALQSLEKSQQDNSRLMKIVAHDLRNPVGAINSFALLMMEEAEDSPNLKKNLGLINASSQNALGLIDDLLNLHPAGNGFAPEPVNILELLQYCIALLQHKAAEKKQQVVLQHGTAVTIRGDREKLWRVFSNIISNAVKFSLKGATIKVALKAQPGKAIVEVADHGIGIPPELRDKIFEVSPDAKRRGTAGEPSFGLGLVICRQIVELHGGAIWFTSEAGKGTTFYVELPMETKGR